MYSQQYERRPTAMLVLKHLPKKIKFMMEFSSTSWSRNRNLDIVKRREREADFQVSAGVYHDAPSVRKFLSVVHYAVPVLPERL